MSVQRKYERLLDEKIHVAKRVRRLYLSLNLQPKENMTISDEIDAIQAAVTKLQNATPTPTDFLTPPMQAKLDALAASVGVDMNPPVINLATGADNTALVAAVNDLDTEVEADNTAATTAAAAAAPSA